MEAHEAKIALKKKRRWQELKGEDKVDHDVMDNNRDNIQPNKNEKEMKRKWSSWRYCNKQRTPKSNEVFSIF